jgi:hypothetical protein
MMEKELILENEYVSLWFYPEDKIVHHQLHKFIFGDHYKDFFTKGADVFEENGCVKWLSDDTHSSALRQEDIDWGMVNWVPRMIKAGWKYWALVMPNKAVAKMNHRELIEHFKEQGVTVEIVSNTQEGLAWLRSK